MSDLDFVGGHYVRWSYAKSPEQMLDEKDAEIERLTMERDNARSLVEAATREGVLAQVLADVERLTSDLHAAECEIEEFRYSRDFYKRRCDELQKAQRHMRDPERKAVCDILANGKTAALAGKEESK